MSRLEKHGVPGVALNVRPNPSVRHEDPGTAASRVVIDGQSRVDILSHQTRTPAIAQRKDN